MEKSIPKNKIIKIPIVRIQAEGQEIKREDGKQDVIIRVPSISLDNKINGGNE